MSLYSEVSKYHYLSDNQQYNSPLSMYSILLRMPQANYLLLKELLRVLLKIKTSTSNSLDTYNLSVRIAPHVLWDPTCLKSLFGCDLSKKVSGSDFPFVNKVFIVMQ